MSDKSNESPLGLPQGLGGFCATPVSVAAISSAEAVEPLGRAQGRLVARALPLTLGAATLLVLAMIFGVIVFEAMSRSSHVAEPTDQLVLRKDGQIVIMSVGGTSHSLRSLEGELLPPFASGSVPVSSVSFETPLVERSSAEFLTLGTESVWKRTTSNHPQRRVQSVGWPVIGESWHFHNQGERGEYVITSLATRQRLGFVGRHGFKASPLTEDEQFDTSNHRLNQRVRLGWQQPFGDALAPNIRPSEWAASTHEVILQDDDRRAYWIDFSTRTSKLIHDGERVVSANTLSASDDKPLRIALRLADRIVVKALVEPFETLEVVALPELIRSKPSFTWVTHDGDTITDHIFVVASPEYLIVWADSTGTVLRQKSVTLRNPSPDFNEVDGTLVEMPLELMWAVGALQFPAFSLWLVGGAFEPGTTIVGGGFDAEFALASMHATTIREVRLNTWRASAWPLLATEGLALFWVVMAQRRLRRWGATRRERWFWGCWIAVFGLPGYLALRTHRSWPALRTCAACSGEVPCNRQTCVACGADNCGDAVVGRALLPVVSRDGQEYTSYSDKRPARRPIGQRLMGLSDAVLEGVERTGLALATRMGRNAGPAVLMVKELRSITGIALLATMVFVVVLGRAMELRVFAWFDLPVSHSYGYMTAAANFEKSFVVIAAVVALVLGFWQTVPEGWGGAWLFLLHRPVSRRTVMASKLAAGWGLLLALTAWPILCFGWWANLPGSIAAPFEWSMTESLWRLWWLMPLLYLGAFASGLRTANWWGSRLMPLVAMAGAFVVRDQWLSRLWPLWLELGLASGLMAAVVTVILTVGREQDYA